MHQTLSRPRDAPMEIFAMLRPNWSSDDQRKLDQTYEVIVGHSRVRVCGASPAEAIEMARRQLCVDMPRMWDVIHGLELQRFTVREIIE